MSPEHEEHWRQEPPGDHLGAEERSDQREQHEPDQEVDDVPATAARTGTSRGKYTFRISAASLRTPFAPKDTPVDRNVQGTRAESVNAAYGTSPVATPAIRPMVSVKTP